MPKNKKPQLLLYIQMNSQAIQAYYTTHEDQTKKIIMVKTKRNRKAKNKISAICSFLTFVIIRCIIPYIIPTKEKTHSVIKKANPIISSIYYSPNTLLRYSSFVIFPICKSACNDKFSLLKS